MSDAPLSARLGALQTRVQNSIPPRWIEVGRQHPVLWMVVAPVVVAVLFISVLKAFEPEPRPSTAAVSPAASAQAASPATSAAEAPQPAPVAEESKSAALAGLEGKAPESLSVDELLLVSSGQAQKKRDDAKALSRKLQDQADLVSDQTVQAQLLRFAADPDTAADALGAMARAKAPVGPDLLYEVWSNKALPATTTELARSLLSSREVRPGASAALAVAITLRGSASCEAIDAVLPQAASDGDRRSLWLLAKLNSRRGCGEKKNQDCYACLRAHTKQVLAAGEAVKKRAAPSYPR